MYWLSLNMMANVRFVTKDSSYGHNKKIITSEELQTELKLFRFYTV